MQRFLGESRTTADVAGASRIIQELSRGAERVAHSRLSGQPQPYGLIVPTPSTSVDGRYGTTNKVAFLAPAGTGPELVREVATAVRQDWTRRVRQVFPDDVQPTPGMPDISWVCVTGSAEPGEYSQLWERARAALVARRRTRPFTPLLRRRVNLCSQSPQLPASSVPTRAQKHERRGQERLSAAGWVKRMAAREGDSSFPSTVAIASTSFRARLIALGRDTGDAELSAAVKRLDASVDELQPPREKKLEIAGVPESLRPLADRLGAWVFPDRWDVDGLDRAGITASQATVAKGRAVAADLLRVAKRLGVRSPPARQDHRDTDGNECDVHTAPAGPGAFVYVPPGLVGVQVG